MNSAKLVFPAVKGIQANMEYYIAMIPLSCIPKLFTFSDENLPPEIRSQRILNKARIPEICNYIVKNPTSYVFSALTASVDGELFFDPLNQDTPSLGNVSIDISSKLLINDGQHRRAAIEAALKINPDLKYEHISMVLYHDIGLKRSQQMFSDLNRHAIRPTKSLNILYDSRNNFSLLVKEVIDNIEGFAILVDKEHTSIPNRSVALFTLSALFHGTKALLNNSSLVYEDQKSLAILFWSQVFDNMTEWKEVGAGKIKSSIIRRESLSPLSITIKSLGEVGKELVEIYPDNWQNRLKVLQNINWLKTNPTWQNGIVVNGSVQLSRATQKSMTNYIRSKIL